MSHGDLQKTIDAAWEAVDSISLETMGEVRDAVETALNLLDKGEVRVAEKLGGEWHVNQWLKKAVLLSFRLNDMATIPGGPGANAPWWDKVPSKFEGWGAKEFRAAGFRAVPNCIVRHSAYIAPSVVLMPSFTNLGAYVDEGTMVDTWATVGSCAQIGKNVHLVWRRRHWRRIGAVTGRTGYYRRQLLYRRAVGSGRGRDCGRRRGAVHGLFHQCVHEDI